MVTLRGVDDEADADAGKSWGQLDTGGKVFRVVMFGTVGTLGLLVLLVGAGAVAAAAGSRKRRS